MKAPETVKTVTDLLTLRLSDIAQVIGVTPQVLSQWRTGKRVPSSINLRALAGWFDRHAKRIGEAADLLRRLADDLDDPARREAVVVTVGRPDAAKRSGAAGTKPKEPPQFRLRRGCLSSIWRALASKRSRLV